MNNNGIISFNAPVGAYTPEPFPLESTPLIAPYWADVDTRGTGIVRYRQTSDPALLARARDDVSCVSQKIFIPTFLVIATWDHVGYFESHVDKVCHHHQL